MRSCFTPRPQACCRSQGEESEPKGRRVGSSRICIRIRGRGRGRVRAGAGAPAKHVLLRHRRHRRACGGAAAHAHRTHLGGGGQGWDTAGKVDAVARESVAARSWMHSFILCVGLPLRVMTEMYSCCNARIMCASCVLHCMIQTNLHLHSHICIHKQVVLTNKGQEGTLIGSCIMILDAFRTALNGTVLSLYKRGS